MKYIIFYCGNDDEWQNGLKNFSSYFESIKNRFSKRFFSFFSQSYMHDSILKEMVFRKKHLSQRTRIDIITFWEQEGNSFSLLFKDVKTFKTNMSLLENYCEFGDFVIGEFLAIDEEYLSFEFQFFNESTVYIEFKKIIYKTQKQGHTRHTGDGSKPLEHTGDGSVC